jgi:hypothetical protein
MPTLEEQSVTAPTEEYSEEIAIEDENENIEDVPYRSKDPRRLNTQPYDYAVRGLVDMIVEGDLKLNPEYQRNYRWDDKQASRFVESLLLNIPVPVIYLNEEKDTKLTVIDGQQRLASLLRFIKPEELKVNPLFNSMSLEALTLQELRVRSELNGFTIRKLSPEDRSTLQKRHIRCIVILNESDSTLKFEVFERLNTGSVKLTDQEVRNCVYNGPLNELLIKATKYPKYQELIKLQTKDKNNMKDAELVLRFFAYRELPEDYSGNYTEYLNDYMEEHRIISDARYQELLNIFEKTVNLCHGILGTGVAFLKPSDRKNPSNTGWAKSYMNGAIYDSQMIVYSCLPKLEELSPTNIEQIRNATFQAFANDDYWKSIAGGTARSTQIKRRITSLYDSIVQVIELVPLPPSLRIN